MKYQAYPKYKDSEVEWLGMVPEEWSSTKIKWCSKRYSGGTPDRNNPEYWENGTIPWIASGEVNQRIIIEPTEYISELALKESSAKWIPVKSVIMALAGQGKTKGMVAITGIPVTGNQSLVAICPTNNTDAYFLLFWLEINYSKIRGLASEDLRDGLNLEMVGSIPVPLPPLPTQISIAQFLDTETAKIDRLIAENQDLITLLQEKRKALISHAVTRGLSELVSPEDPEFGEWAKPVKFKDSGVEWLGMVPEGWKVKRLKFLFEIQKRIVGTDGFEILSITQRGMKIKDIESNEGQLSMDYTKYQLVEVGDFAMNHMDLLTGFVDLSPFRGVTSPDYRVFTLRDKNVSSPRFYLYVLQLCYQQKIFFPFGQGSSQLGRWRLPTDAFNNLVYPVPSMNEQLVISKYIDREMNRITKLIEETELSSKFVKEYRSSLITNAVTGKIKVN